MFRGRLKLLLLGLAITGAIAWELGSPHYALNRLREAALADDRAELEQRIDFPALRQSVKSEMAGMMASGMDKTGEGDNPLVTLGGALMTVMIEPAVDELVSPRGIKLLVAYGRLDSRRSPPGEQKPVEWRIERDGLNRFEARTSAWKSAEAVSLVFERDWFGWTLVGVDLGGDAEAE
jgi:hypothetical protein